MVGDKRAMALVEISGFKVGGAEFPAHKFLEIFAQTTHEGVEGVIRGWNGGAHQSKKSLVGQVRIGVFTESDLEDREGVYGGLEPVAPVAPIDSAPAE